MPGDFLPPRSEPLEELTRVDDAVEPAAERTRDLGIPDGVWWGVTLVVGVIAIEAAGVWLFPRVGQWGMMAFTYAALYAVYGFASRRWGHRRYSLRRAFVDAFASLAILVLILVIYAGVRGALHR